MTKINLNFVDFLLNPDYSKIKDIISWTKEAYIEEYGEQYRKKISDNILKTNLIFINDSDSLENFIKFLIKMQLDDIKIKIENYLDDDVTPLLSSNLREFIVKIIEKRVMSINISEVLLELTELLKELKRNCTTSEEEEIIKKIFNYVDENIFYSIKFDKLINKKRENLKEINVKKKEYKTQLQKEFFEKHSYFLNDEEYKQIFEENKDISEVIKNSKKLSFYFNDFFKKDVLDLGPICVFGKSYNKSCWFNYRERKLKEWDIPYTAEDLHNPDSCLSKLNFYMYDEDGVKHYGVEGLELLDEILDSYNKKCREYCESIDFYLMSKKEFAKKYIISDETLARKSNEHISFLTSEPASYDRFNDVILERIENGFLKEYAGNSSSIIFTYNDSGLKNQTNYQYHYIIIPTFTGITFPNENIFSNNFLFLLNHELGHAITRNRIGFSGYNLDKKITILNELFDDYLANKITNKLLTIIPKDIYEFVNKSYLLHTVNYFLIEPFIPEYEDVFKDASINNNLTPIIDLFGQELFDEYINLINEFYDKQRENENAREIFSEDAKYVESVKEKINNIYKEISKKRRIVK